MKKHIPKILIVDDDQLYLTQFSTILRKEIRADYYFSNNANDAIRLIHKNTYAIILLDVEIPERNGFELAGDIRSSKLNKHTPIIFITGFSIDSNSIFEGYKAGAVDYLSKPVNKFILFSKIKTFLKLDLQKNEILSAHNKLEKSNLELQEKDIQLKRLNKNLEKKVIARTKELVKEINENVKSKANLQIKAIQLKENYQFLETLIETIPNPVYYKNDKGVYIGCNKAFEEHQAKKRKDIIGKNIYDLTTREFANEITRADAIVIKSGKKLTKEIKFPDLDGSIKNLILYKNKFHFPHSNKIGIIGTLIDVTELTRAKGLINIQHTIDYLASMEKGRKNFYKNILASILGIEWVQSGGIYLLDDEKQDLTLVAHKSLTKKFIERVEYFLPDSEQVKLVKNKKPLYLSIGDVTEISQIETYEENFELLVLIPIVHRGKVLGSLNVASKSKKKLSATDKTEIESLTSQLGNLIAYALVQDKLKTYQKDLEQKIKERTKVLREANIRLNKEIEVHKQTKTALHASEFMYRSIFDYAQDEIIIFDLETLKIVKMNNKAHQVLGFSFNDIPKLKFGDFCASNDTGGKEDILKQLTNNGQVTFQARHQKTNKKLSYMVVNASVIELNGKKYIQSLIHDITKIKEKEIALQLSEKKYKDLQSNIPIGMWTTNLKGQFIYINKAGLKMLGYDSEEKLSGLSILDIYYNKNERGLLIKQIKAKGFIKNWEVQFLRKDKTAFWGNVSANAVYNNKKELLRIDGIIEDISERKSVRTKLMEAHEEIKLINKNLKKRVEDAIREEQQQHQYMIQKSKIESLGELAAGIAHEINQPLGVMSLSIENLHMKISSNKTTPKYVNEKFKSIESNINRIRRIVDHIRTFSHESDSFALEKVIVNKGITNALLLIGTQYQNHNIKIKLDLKENTGFTVGSKQKFEQVMLNLLSNAKYAVEERALNQSESEYQKMIHIITDATEKRIIVAVEDNGIGIKSENLTKIFNPFYTSKPEGVGTGLGLSIAYGIVKDMRGEIMIDSKWNEYTRVKISFPRFPENV
jgi:PAS domain S-box-containing protein